MKGKKTFEKKISYMLLCLLLIPTFIMSFAASVSAKTDYCPPFEDLCLYVRNSAGQDVYLKHYSLSELETLFPTNQIVYYSQIDSMGALVLGAAQGIPLEDFFLKVQSDLQAQYPDVTFDFDPSTTQCRVVAEDGGASTIKIDTMPQYLYPHLFENWDYSSCQLKSDSSGTDYASLAFADAQEIKPILALRSYQERVGDGADYIEGNIISAADLEAAEAVVSAHMDQNNAIRYILGLTQEDVLNGVSTAAKSLKWINRISIIQQTPLNYPEQGTCAIPKITTVPGPKPGECTVSFNSDTPDAQIYYSIAYQTSQDKVIGPCHLYDGTPFTVNMDTNANGKIDQNPAYTVQPTGIQIQASAAKVGWSNSNPTSSLYDYQPKNAPVFTPDTTDNTYGNPIDITFDETDNGAWRGNITAIIVSGAFDNNSVIVDSAHYQAVAGKITFDNTVFTPSGSTSGKFTIIITASGYWKAGVPGYQIMKQSSPGLTTAATKVGQDVLLSLTDPDNEAWQTAISSITVDGSTLDSAKYNTATSGVIRIDNSVFPTNKVYTIVIKANGYSDALVTQSVGEEPASYIRGDINEDNTVNILDVVETVNCALGKTTPSNTQLTAADLTGDGSLNMLDVVQIVNLTLGR